MSRGYIDLGELVKIHRLRAGLTQAELGRLAGISGRAIRQIESSRSVPRAATLQRLSRALNLDKGSLESLCARAQEEPLIHVRILGPLSIGLADKDIEVSSPVLRTLIGLLALHAGQPVTCDAIADALWEEDIPPNFTDRIHVHISRLRRLFASTNVLANNPIVRTGAAYTLVLDNIHLDLAVFERWLRLSQGQEAVESPRRTLELLAAALDCWRGPVLADCEPALREHPLAVAAHHRRVAAATAYGDAMARAGDNSNQGVERLRAVAHHNPFSEGLHARLIWALGATGESSAGLQVYAAIQERLSSQLGVDPGPELQRAFLEVLQATPVADHDDQRQRVPAQLPAVHGFSGRTVELAIVNKAFGDRAQTGQTSVLALTGGAGVGKTALALHWAQLNKWRFPDGQLFVNLRGCDLTRPLTAGEALTTLLRALGITGTDLPLTVDELTTRYRTALTGKKILVVLDNALHAEQIRPLLPTSAGCGVIITSRDALTGLAVLDGVHRLPIHCLDPADAMLLLQHTIGERVLEHPSAAAELAGRCAHLPLALRIAAEWCNRQAQASLPELMTRLDDRAARLDVLSSDDDPRSAMRTVLSWSLKSLATPAKALFGMLGLNPGPDIDLEAAAALAGIGVQDADEQMRLLTQANLVESRGNERYHMHDLLKALAAEIGEHSGKSVKDNATSRLLQHYCATAASAMDRCFPAEHPRRPDTARGQAFQDERHARAWLNAERANLIAACCFSAANDRPQVAMDLARTLFRFFDTSPAEALVVQEQALIAARITRDRSMEAAALANLGGTYRNGSRYEEARRHLEAALSVYSEVGDSAGAARTLNNLGIVLMRLGISDQAKKCHYDALALYDKLSDPVGTARTYHNLGNVLTRGRDFQDAQECLQRALSLHSQAGHQPGVAYSLNGLGVIACQQGHYDLSLHQLRRALIVFRRCGHAGQAGALTNLGDLRLALRQPTVAIERFQAALKLFEETGDLYGQACAHNGIGEAMAMLDQLPTAVAHHVTALTLARRTGDTDEASRAQQQLDQMTAGLSFTEILHIQRAAD